MIKITNINSQNVKARLNIFSSDFKIDDTSWNQAFANTQYTRKFILGCLFIVANLCFFPYFFAYIQQRPGIQLHDIVLRNLPSHDVSVTIFSVIYFSVIIGIRRALKYPQLFLTFMWAYILLNLVRMTTIFLVPLEPPIGLVSLSDPLLVPFYGKTSITKDLFFSGHTSTVFLVLLVVKEKWEKILMAFSVVVVAILLLIQHIHYTIDVVSAPFFVFVIYHFAKKIASVKMP